MCHDLPLLLLGISLLGRRFGCRSLFGGWLLFFFSLGWFLSFCFFLSFGLGFHFHYCVGFSCNFFLDFRLFSNRTRFAGFADEIHHQESVLHAMATAHADAFLRAILEAIDLGTFNMINHSYFDFNTIQSGGSNQKIFAISHEQHALETELVALFNGQAIHFNGAPFDGTVLLAATINNRISHFFLQSSLRRVPAEFLHSSPANGEAGVIRSNSPSDSYC